MRRTPLASIIGGLSKKVGRIATLVNAIGGDFIGRSDFDYRGSPDRHLRKRDFRLLVWKVEPGDCMFFRC